jgi:hypothetical protein
MNCFTDRLFYLSTECFALLKILFVSFFYSSCTEVFHLGWIVFWAMTQCCLVDVCRRFGEHVTSVFKVFEDECSKFLQNVSNHIQDRLTL